MRNKFKMCPVDFRMCAARRAVHVQGVAGHLYRRDRSYTSAKSSPVRRSTAGIVTSSTYKRPLTCCWLESAGVVPHASVNIPQDPELRTCC